MTETLIKASAVGFMQYRVMPKLPVLAGTLHGEAMDGALWCLSQEYARLRACTVDDCPCEDDPVVHAHLAMHYRAEAARLMNCVLVFQDIPRHLCEALADAVALERSRQIVARTGVGLPELEDDARAAQRHYLDLPPAPLNR